MDVNQTWRCMEDVWNIEAQAVSSLSSTIDRDALIAVTELLCNCSGKIVFSGCGTSGVAARKAVHMLNCVEAPSSFLSPSEALHGGLGILRQNDVLILLSKGGQSAEINAFIAPPWFSAAFSIALACAVPILAPSIPVSVNIAVS